jgi:uncharacterized membrane protein
MTTVLLILFYFLTPIAILFVCHLSKALKKLGTIVIAYIIGLAAGNLGILPHISGSFRHLLEGKAFFPKAEALKLLENGAITQSDFFANQVASTQDLIMTIAIPLSIPLLLFSLDIRNSVKTLKNGLFSMIVAIFSLLLAIFIGYFLFKDSIPEVWKIAGMMVGLYTGGTPNLAALATALDVQPSLFILTHTYDLIIGMLLLFFFITVAQKWLNKILPHFNGKGENKTTREIIQESEGVDNFIDYFQWKTTKPLLKAIGASVAIFAVGGGVGLLVPRDMQMAVTILAITTLGILVSLVPSVHKIDKTFEFGMYLILVFSLVVSSMADLRTIFNLEFLNLFLYVVIAVFGSLAIHVVLSYIFKIDTDSTIITITALSTSPPFVPVVAGALKNKDIIVVGITIGVIGYAIGNYLGVIIAYLLKAL